MKKIGIAMISIILILGILVGVLGFVSNGFKNFDMFKKIQPAIEKIKDTELKDVLDEFGNKINDGFKHAFTNKMSFSQGALTASEGQGVTVTLEATVLPVGARNKEVDWSVFWKSSSDATVANVYDDSPVAENNPLEENASALDVADYIVVVPLTDGSPIAYVTCKKAFDTDILIIVATREGEHKATCVVSFVGRPTAMELRPYGNFTLAYDEGWGVDIVTINSGYSKNFNIAISFNSFDKKDVLKHDDIMLRTFKVENIGIGTFMMEATNLSEDLTELVETDYNSKIFNWLSFDAFFENGYLSVSSEHSLFNLMVQPAREYFMYAFGGYTDINKKPYNQIKLTDTISGLSQIINVRVDTTVNSVLFADSKLEF